MRVLIIIIGLIRAAFVGAWFLIVNPIFHSSDHKEIPVSRDRLYADVDFLTSLDPARNHAEVPSLNKAAEYIFNEFGKLDCNPEYQVYEAYRNEYKNVIASFGPEEGKRIVVGAHYDVCGNQAGADDNASAVAGLLEIARLLDELKPDLTMRVDLVAYSLEEPPFYATDKMGSYIHAESLKKDEVELEAMICLEMIGYFSDEKNSQEYPINSMKLVYPNKGNFIAIVGKMEAGKLVRRVKRSMVSACGIKVCSINAPASITGIDFSDHRNYWEMGYEALMITNTSFYRNKNYHTKKDTIETLDFDKMTEVVKGVYQVILDMINNK